MRSLLRTLFLLFLPCLALGQRYAYYNFPDKKAHDSLERIYSAITNDTLKIAADRALAFYFAGSNRDSLLYFLNLDLAASKKFGLNLWEADALDNSAYALWRVGDFPGALQRFLQGIKIASDPESEKSTWGLQYYVADKDAHKARLIILAELHFDLGTLYGQAGYDARELSELKESVNIASENKDKAALSQANTLLGDYYLQHHNNDAALTCLEKGLDYAEQSGFKLFEGDCLDYLGTAWLLKGNYTEAKSNFLRSIVVNRQQNGEAGLTHDYLSMADLFLKQNIKDSSLYYAKAALATTAISHDLSDAALAYNSLSSIFKKSGHIDSAYKYQSLALAASDSLNNARKVRQFENIGFTEQLRVQQLEEEKIAVQNKIRTYAMLAGLAVVLLIAFILWRNNRHKQRANAILAKTLSDLKATQTHLIQSAKMASLGELTAGIAHEIQNPLNFVNNFSEVNTELIDEMQEEIGKGNYDDVKAIADDLKANQQKINQHGKRADFIVKGMLQHSRTSSGQKEPTDLNALADEYLRLAYHGLRAKDKDFNADLVTHFDENLPKVNVIPQDIGRVLLNVINNAFYATQQKAKTAGARYKPEVAITTSAENGNVIVQVRDNGNGIPDAIKDKIMQPFFTTKPTGEGTGLGLSLSYDIVVKGHGGSIQVDSTEDEGSKFIIQLPVN